MTARRFDVAVVGQIARDLVLVVDDLPEAGTSKGVLERRETLGGKGANQAVSLAQLGASVALLGVVGDDPDATALLDRAIADGIQVGSVVRRSRCRTALIVDIVDGSARWRYLEDIPDAMLVTEQDVRDSAPLLEKARAVVVQLQQPTATALEAARIACAAGGLVVLDGAPEDASAVGSLLSSADVVRADVREAQLLTGHELDDADAAIEAARTIMARGPRLVALAVGKEGNVFVWRDGSTVLPLADVPVVDSTGAGDAFTATLTLALVRGAEPERAAAAAVAAAADTVGHAGGRPHLRSELFGSAD